MTERERFRGDVDARRAMQRIAVERCPWCGRKNPQRWHGRGGAKWAEAYGHRCPHGEACPAGGDPGGQAICTRCAMAGETAGTMFRCEPYQATLTRAACARRHQLANGRGAEVDATSRLQLAISKCQGCDVGAEHARGGSTTPDVAMPTPAIAAEDLVRPKRRSRREESLERDQFRSSAAGPRPAETPASPAAGGETDGMVPPAPATTTARTSAREARTMANPGKQYEHNGQSKSLKEWAKSIGITDGGLRLRLKKMSFADALALGDGSGGAPKPAARGKPTKAPASRGLQEEVRNAAAAIAPAELLRSLGWTVDQLGHGPNGGELLVVRSGE